MSVVQIKRYSEIVVVVFSPSVTWELHYKFQMFLISFQIIDGQVLKLHYAVNLVPPKCEVGYLDYISQIDYGHNVSHLSTSFCIDTSHSAHTSFASYTCLLTDVQVGGICA